MPATPRLAAAQPAAPSRAAAAQRGSAGPGPATILIGPEGGFTRDEAALAGDWRN